MKQPILYHLCHTTGDTSNYKTRASRDSTYQFIISDLQFATDHLPVKEQTATGRATKGAAATLMTLLG